MAAEAMISSEFPPLRVLSLDGGGMRGTYTATYLDRVAASFASRQGVAALDIGAAFDLIVGTSTGGIIACALAAGIPLAEIVKTTESMARPFFLSLCPLGPSA
jgi:patatin-like phospholipase/acyl hydrolase